MYQWCVLSGYTIISLCLSVVYSVSLYNNITLSVQCFGLLFSMYKFKTVLSTKNMYFAIEMFHGGWQGSAGLFCFWFAKQVSL